MDGRDLGLVTVGCCCLLCIGNLDTHARSGDCALNIALAPGLPQGVFVWAVVCRAFGFCGILVFGCWVFGVGCWALALDVRPQRAARAARMGMSLLL